MESRRLSELKIGESAVVVGVNHSEPTLLQRLVTLGLVEGTSVRVTQRGLFGSPINIQVLGSVLSLRSAEACHIQVSTVA